MILTDCLAIECIPYILSMFVLLIGYVLILKNVVKLISLIFLSLKLQLAQPSFFLLGVGVGFHPSLSSNGGGMILSSYSCTIYLTLFRGVGIGLILGLGTGLSGLTFFFKNSFIN